MKTVKFGLFLPTGDFAAARAAALAAERDGFYSVSTNDHFFSPLGGHDSPQLECFTSLTAIAALTRRVRLVPAVVAASFRNPALLAKISSTLDQVSDGRFTLGLGAGWFDAEYRAHGYAFAPTAERLAQLDETVRIVKAMWCDAEPRFRGRYFSIDGAYNHPRPVQRPHPPLMLGGSGSGLLRLAAVHADILNLIPPTSNGRDFVNDPAATVRYDMAVLERKIAELHRYAEAAGRDPAAIELSGLALIGLSPEESDPALRAIAGRLGFTDYASAQRSPVALLGTPNQVVDELHRRIGKTGITYHILLPMSAQTQALFVDAVMPAFGA